MASLYDRLAVLLQFGVVTALFLLFHAVRRRRAHAVWLGSWTAAWLALWVAIAAIALHFDLLLPLNAVGLLGPADGPLLVAIEATYQLGKVAFFLLLLDGAWRARFGSAPPRHWRQGAAVLGAVFAAATLVDLPAANRLDALLERQAMLAVPAAAFAALLLARRPHRTGDIGSRLCAVGFGALALLWTGYAYGLANAGSLLRTTADGAVIGALLGNNSTIDAFMAALLGYAMLVLLTEEEAAAQDAQRRAQLDAVAASELRLTRLIEAALDAILTLDGDFRIVQANAAAGAVLGLAPAKLVGLPFERFLPPEELADWRERWGLDRDPVPPPVRRHFRARRGTGESFPVDASLAPIGPDRAAGFVVILRDESETERAVLERERLRQRLAQAQRLETVGQLVSGVAHELNSPLAAILGHAEELRHGALGQRESDVLGTMIQQVQRCRGIVRDLLRVARKRDVRLRPIEPRPLVQRVIRGFEPAAAAARISLRLVAPATLEPIIADEGALEQVLANLITNALQASPRLGVVVVEARPAGDRLELIVEDDGPGITPEVQARLFEPFFTTRAPGAGTGLGLPVTRGLVEQLGGTLVLENRPSPATGVHAVVTLPFARQAAVSTPLPVPLPASSGIGRRVLVIDDEAPVRAAVRRYLERKGWRVDEAQDGRAALARLNVADGDGPHDLIISDIRMPLLSGIELYDLLAATRPELLHRIVLITGDPSAPTVADFLARTWAPLVEKPFDLDVLDAAIARVFAEDRPEAVPTS